MRKWKSFLRWSVKVYIAIDIMWNIVGFEWVAVSWIAIRKRRVGLDEAGKRRRRGKYIRCG
jgi:hypothetical protein